LCPYPLYRVPGQRFRFEQYLGILNKANIETTVEPFFDESTLNILYEPGHALSKVWGVMLGLLRRMRTLFSVRRYDYIFIFREAAPLGPPIIESLLFGLRRRVIYDFDDAIFTSDGSPENPVIRWLKWRSKVAYITKHSYKVTVCNSFLFDWATRLNRSVVLLPTTIDPTYYRPSRGARASSRPVIGWSGSYSKSKYLALVRPVLKALQQSYDFAFRVICNIDPGFPELRNYRFIKWKSSTEVEDLGALDIGLMPVPDDTWAKGKVGLKAVQNAALGIVPVVSAVGSGSEVVRHGETGLVVNNTDGEWNTALKTLLENRQTWAELGKAAREYILPIYSVPAQAETYIALFDQ
jgi:glycosyltransferase involved in cell wall biosynthesis